MIKNIVRRLSEQGYRIGVIKHHGHGGPPDLIEPETVDTTQFRKEGAVVTAVEGDGTIVMKLESDLSLELDGIVSIYQHLPIDLIVVEGYKEAVFPKIAVLRSKEDWAELSSNFVNFLGLIQPGDLKVEGQSELPHFHFEQSEVYVDYIKERFLEGS